MQTQTTATAITTPLRKWTTYPHAAAAAASAAAEAAWFVDPCVKNAHQRAMSLASRAKDRASVRQERLALLTEWAEALFPACYSGFKESASVYQRKLAGLQRLEAFLEWGGNGDKDVDLIHEVGSFLVAEMECSTFATDERFASVQSIPSPLRDLPVTAWGPSHWAQAGFSQEIPSGCISREYIVRNVRLGENRRALLAQVGERWTLDLAIEIMEMGVPTRLLPPSVRNTKEMFDAVKERRQFLRESRAENAYWASTDW